MNSIKMILPVTVKAKLTEKLRARLVDEATKVAEQMELELKQINIDMQRELENNPQHEAQIRNSAEKWLLVKGVWMRLIVAKRLLKNWHLARKLFKARRSVKSN